MRHSPFLITTTEALQRVFLPTIRPLPHTSQLHQRPSLHPLKPITYRHASTRPQAGAFNLAGKFVSSAKTGPQSKTPSRPRDEAIRAPLIHVVQPDSKLSAPKALSWALRTIDRKTHFLEQHDTIEGVPICKIISKDEARAAEKERRKSKIKHPSQTTKYLELNWAIDQNDLAHRLGKLKQFLMEGRRVEVFLAKKKKRMRDATEAEGRATLERIKECVRGVEGAREMREMDGKFLERATLFFEGKRVKKEGGEGDDGGEDVQGRDGGEKAGGDQEGGVEEEESPRQAAYG